MRTIITAFVLVLLFGSAMEPRLSAQPNVLGGRLEWLNPPLGTEPIHAIHTVDAKTIELYADDYLLRSTDRGSTWSVLLRDPVALRYASSAAWIDGRNGWSVPDPDALDPTDTLQVTTDGGLTWTPHQIGVRGIRALRFVDAQVGWGVGDAMIVRTEDGGAHWRAIPDLGWSSMRQIAAPTRTDAYVPTYVSDTTVGLLRTRDGGVTWDTLDFVKPIELDIADINDLVFFDALNGLVFSSEGAVYRTTDGGKSWARKPTGIRDKGTGLTGASLRLSAMVDAARGWAFTNYDEIVYTTDGGGTWSVQDTGKAPVIVNGTLALSPTFSAVRIIGTDSLLAVSLSADVMTTTDAGSRWRALNHGFTANYLAGVAFTSLRSGYAVEALGTVHRTTDGGATWSSTLLGTDKPAVDVIAVDSLHAWVPAGDGLYRTTDGGATWQLRTIPGFPVDSVFSPGTGITTVIGIRCARFLSPLRGWAVGKKGVVFGTVDGGDTWSRLGATADSVTLYGISFIDEQHGWVVGDGASVFVTADGGATWTAQSTGDVMVPGKSVYETYRAVQFRDALHGVVAGDHGRLFTTANGGASWNTVPTGIARDWKFGTLSKVAITGSTIWVGGARGGFDGGGTVLLRSTDDGATWTDPQMPASLATMTGLGGISWLDPGHGWLAGSRGEVVRYTAVTGDVPMPRMPDRTGASLTLRATPNPSRGSATLHVEGASRGAAVLRLLDPLAREVTPAMQTGLEQGKNDLPIDLTALPAGLYFLRLESGSVIASTPVMIVK